MLSKTRLSVNLDNPAARLGDFCARRAGLVVLLTALAAAFCAYYAVRHVRIDTDVVRLMSTDLPWRQREQEIDRAFPQSKNLIVVVLDAATQESADIAADNLVARLREHPDLVLAARRPDGGPFFAKNGLLFLSTDSIQKQTDSLIAAQGLLGPLAADPSLRGVFDTFSLALRGVREGATIPDQLAKPFASLADAFEAIADGRPQPFSWRRLVSGVAPSAADLRRIILVQPKLDFESLEPGAGASSLIRAQAKAMSIPARVRLTGPIALADEEFTTLADGAALNFAGALAALL
ncbi:MAG: hopanoid biosynthesis-associated RND transporter HpnN, partial [Deltaproteobacteria bacterium]|nr:hopanoid biosynthesis-associated RND transporter HpnN [Deltaproteobacteria bacterium]